MDPPQAELQVSAFTREWRLVHVDAYGGVHGNHSVTQSEREKMRGWCDWNDVCLLTRLVSSTDDLVAFLEPQLQVIADVTHLAPAHKQIFELVLRGRDRTLSLLLLFTFMVVNHGLAKYILDASNRNFDATTLLHFLVSQTRALMMCMPHVATMRATFEATINTCVAAIMRRDTLLMLQLTHRNLVNDGVELHPLALYMPLPPSVTVSIPENTFLSSQSPLTQQRVLYDLSMHAEDRLYACSLNEYAMLHRHMHTARFK